MATLGAILRAAGPAYLAAFGDRMLPSHRRTLADLAACRTSALGASEYRCDRCRRVHTAPHSCRNRHCPVCHADRTRRWLAALARELLPCPYYLVTFTLPGALRRLARSHQRRLYHVLIHEAAASLQLLAYDPRFVGARLGMVAVLHTWTRAMVFHPHVHILVTGGGLDGEVWRRPRNPRFLVPGYALSKLFRARVRRALAGLAQEVPAEVWASPWVVHVKHAGDGARVASYLARYVHRVAISQDRIELFDDARVVFRYSDSRTHEVRRCELPASDFIARFLQHVLPRGFTKVRHYGLFAPACRAMLATARTILEQHQVGAAPAPATSTADQAGDDRPPWRCPYCHLGRLHFIRAVHRQRGPP